MTQPKHIYAELYLKNNNNNNLYTFLYQHLPSVITQQQQLNCAQDFQYFQPVGHSSWCMGKLGKTSSLPMTLSNMVQLIHQWHYQAPTHMSTVVLRPESMPWRHGKAQLASVTSWTYSTKMYPNNHGNLMWSSEKDNVSTSVGYGGSQEIELCWIHTTYRWSVLLNI